RIACALVGNRNDGDDLVQSTLEKLMTKGVPNNVNLRAWAFRVCRNLRIDSIRSTEVRSRLDPEYVGQSPLHEDGERAMMNKLLLDDVSRAMEDLPVDQRAALALVALEGYSYAEAAETLDVSIGTIMSRVHRARHKLVEAFNDSPPSLN
ncbi:MAG: RNA polymerase sigma factor, partial [Henriciella sp.]|nr:RNA polymerase sigma factor [Henriciella sp.]